jgi:hypothetical protein
MSSLRSSVVLVALVSLSCGGGAPQPDKPSTRAAAAILSHVPAESPYLLASLDPLSERVRGLMWADSEYLVRVRSALETVRSTDPDKRQPWMRAVLAIAEELRGKEDGSWWRHLGFAPSGRFVVYGLSVWPVIRIEVADPTRLRGVIDRALSAGGIKPRQAELGGHRYWTGELPDISFVAAVLEHEVVLALLPSGALQAALPLVLGIQRPPRSLATTSKVAELLGRHRLLGHIIGYFDTRNMVDIATSETPSELDAPFRAATGPIPAGCRSDLDRLVAVMPRMVFGHRKIDETGFAGTAVIETAPDVVGELSKLRTVVPEASAASSRSLMSLGVAINPDELLGWLRSVTGRLAGRPFTCPWLAPINAAAAELARELPGAIPPMLKGVRGFSMVVDDATAEPLRIDGHLIVAGERIADTLSSFISQLPWLAAIPLKPGGQPVAIPTQQLGLPIPSAHVAITSDRVVVATGAASAQRVTAHLATPAPRSSPLLVISFDGVRLQELLASVGEADGDFLASLGQMSFSLDVASAGLEIGVWGPWTPRGEPGSPPRP